jgi:glycosyltransferase involved in cell wall biosynthesis
MSSSSSSSTPRLSIGVPVYNGERFVARTIDCMLRQTFGNFELIIADNASTDGTEAICRAFAARDPRVRYERADANLGIVRNFNRCVSLARGELFHWHAADDMAEPTLLEACIAVLDADPSVVLAFARTMLIDEADRPTRPMEYDVDADHPAAHVRFGRVINLDHHKHCAQEVYGVIRRAALLRTPLYEPIARTDSILLARLALLGRFRAVDRPLFLNREHEGRSVRLVPGQGTGARTRMARWLGIGPVPPPEFWDPRMTGRINFPEWRILGAYIRSLQLASSPAERTRCGLTLGRFAIGHTRKLARDVLIAIEHAVLGHPAAGGLRRAKSASPAVSAT